MEGHPWGGSEELWSQTAERMVKAGHVVGVNVQGWPTLPDKIARLQQLGCELRTRQSRLNLSRIGNVMRARHGFRWLDYFRPEFVVISQGLHTDGIAWAQACLSRHIPYVLIAEAASEQWWPPDGDVAILRRVYEAAAASFFVSQRNLELARRQFVSDLPNAHIVRNPYKVPYRDAATLSWPESAEGLRLACIGRLEPAAKGQDILLQILRGAKWRARKAHLTVVGSGPNSASLQDLTRHYNLTNVTFSGFIEDIEEFWQQQHALVLPSRHEGLPLVVVEAMLCGRMCIVSDVAGNAELLEDNVTGFVAAAPTVELFEAAMERAWQRGAEWQQIGQAAAHSIRQAIPRDPIGAFIDQLTPLMP